MSSTTRISPKDVCLIIEAAAKAGVKALTFAGLTLEFGQKPDEIEILEPMRNLIESPERDPDSPLTEQEKADLYDQMLIDDPLALEEQIMSGDDEAV